MYLVLVAGLVLAAVLLAVILLLAWKRRSRQLQPLGYERLAFRAPQQTIDPIVAELNEDRNEL